MPALTKFLYNPVCSAFAYDNCLLNELKWESKNDDISFGEEIIKNNKCMKKIFLSVAVILLAGVVLANKVNREAKKEARKEKKAVRAQEREGREGLVSYQSEEQFAIDFPKATDVVFERSKNFDEAEFTLDGKSLRAYYDIESKLIGTTCNGTYAELPASAQKDINKEYKDYEVKQVILFHDNEENDTDMSLYGSSFEDADNYFVQLEKNGKSIVVKVTPLGLVSFYKDLR